MEKILLIAQVVVACLLMLFILVQNKEGGLGGSFGSSGEGFQATRRGAEKVIFVTTVILATLFLGLAIVSVIL